MNHLGHFEIFDLRKNFNSQNILDDPFSEFEAKFQIKLNSKYLSRPLLDLCRSRHNMQNIKINYNNKEKQKYQ